MGGTSTSQTTQQSSTTPWETGQGIVNSLVGQLTPQINNSGLNSTESGAISQLIQNAQNGNPYAPQIGGLASNLLSGGGATAQSGAIQGGLSTLQGELTPYANGSMVGNNPALQSQLDQIRNDVTNQVNGQFAAAGRSGSGMNTQTLARGIAQGEAPVIANQYNQDVNNQLNAANTLYGAQNTTSGLLTGLTQQGLTNQLQGVNTAGDALTAQNYGPTATLAASELGQSIPAQNLGLLAQIGIPIAGLGTNSTGSGTTTNQMSGAQQFASIMGGIGSLGNLFKSDRRLKEDIEQVGTLFDGTPVYRYRYKGHAAFTIGVMAQDIEKVTPEAVHEINGFKAVDYKMATEKAVRAA